MAVSPNTREHFISFVDKQNKEQSKDTSPKQKSLFPLNGTSIENAGIGTIFGLGLCKMLNTPTTPVIISKPLPPPSHPYNPGQFIIDNIKKGHYGRASLTGINTILFKPAIEETVFRGVIYPLADKDKLTTTEKAKEIAKSSALFAAVHVNPSGFFKAAHLIESARSMPRLFVAGTALCALADLTGDLVAPIVAHSVSNGSTLADDLRHSKLRLHK